MSFFYLFNGILSTVIGSLYTRTASIAIDFLKAFQL